MRPAATTSARPAPPPTEPVLNRDAAAAWIRSHGYSHVTKRHLDRLADSGRGPPYALLGRRAYYRQADLRSWLEAETRPVERGRTPPKDGT